MAERQEMTTGGSMRDGRLARWERRSTPFILAAAVVPLLPAFTSGERATLTAIVELIAWGVFVVDLAVHVRYRQGYLRTKIGVFDLVIVVGTFPWYLMPGLGGAAVLGLLRVARIGRILAVGLRTGPLRQLSKRLGAPAVVVLVSVFVAGAVVVRADPETYETYGDGVWWAFVTVTTVGYGDYTPTSSAGRIIAVLLMFVGVAMLGVVAASLASFFAGSGTDEEPPEKEAGAPPDGALVAAIEELRAEVASLRAELGRGPDAEP